MTPAYLRDSIADGSIPLQHRNLLNKLLNYRENSSIEDRVNFVDAFSELHPDMLSHLELLELVFVDGDAELRYQPAESTYVTPAQLVEEAGLT